MGFIFWCDVFLFIFFDEEIGGVEGVGVVLVWYVYWFEEFWVVFDEGIFVVFDFVVGMIIVLVVVGEKCFVMVEVSVNGEVGYSSMFEFNVVFVVFMIVFVCLYEFELEVWFLLVIDVFFDCILFCVLFGEWIVLWNCWFFGGVVESMFL